MDCIRRLVLGCRRDKGETMKKIIIIVAAFIASLLVIGETGARLSGLTDFPLYLSDNRIGYMPAPSQSGSFMRSNDWAFNELSMGTARSFAPTQEKTDILLVGDSIVLGGNPYKQSDRLGPQLEMATGATVWPISAGSWALQNELEYLLENKSVVKQVDHVIFVLNSADFERPSSWSSELTHPRERPICALCYLAQKYVLRPASSTPSDLAVNPRDPIADLRAFAEEYRKPFDVWLYPNKAEMLDKTEWSRRFAPSIQRLESAKIDGMRLHFGAEVLGWRAEDYRDDIHPTPQATEKLARAIASKTPSSQTGRVVTQQAQPSP